MLSNKKLGLSRLSKLADFLEEKVPANRFDLGCFREEDQCGTVGCACGWATILFEKNGFVWKKEMYGFGSISYKHLMDFEAAEEFFRLYPSESLHLFHPRCYPEKKQYKMYVVRRIRQFVKSQSATA
jgi:hypothetical protein